MTLLVFAGKLENGMNPTANSLTLKDISGGFILMFLVFV
jgi:hypothetical protein